MKFEISCFIDNKNLIKYLEDKTEYWEVMPGVGMFEKEFKSLEELYTFIEDCEIYSDDIIDFKILPLSTKVDIRHGICSNIIDEEPIFYLEINSKPE